MNDEPFQHPHQSPWRLKLEARRYVYDGIFGVAASWGFFFWGGNNDGEGPIAIIFTLVMDRAFCHGLDQSGLLSFV
jgi:hypothetical protein